MDKKIHIVCLDAPCPPDYGGAIDMYYKIIAIARAGYKIILHYFNYNDRNAEGLEEYCFEVNRYARKKGVSYLLDNKPYIIYTRINQKLIQRLNNDNYPIILEGIHCTGIIPYLDHNRKIVVRLHNKESAYYKRLAEYEVNKLKKHYYNRESKRLEKYEHNLDPAFFYFSISETDRLYFKYEVSLKNSMFLPAFIPWKQGNPEGTGDYCLYHGNLGISENEEAAIWLIKHVFSQINYPCIIAGKGITKRLRKEAQSFDHITLESDPADKDMETLIEQAHIHIIPSLNVTGVKLKLLHVLLRGRHCIANKAAVDGSLITKGYSLAEQASDYISLIKQLKETPFTRKHIEERNEVATIYNNDRNAEKLIAFL